MASCGVSADRDVLILLDVSSLDVVPGESAVWGDIHFSVCGAAFPRDDYTEYVDQALARWIRLVRFGRFRSGTVSLDFHLEFFSVRCAVGRAGDGQYMTVECVAGVGAEEVLVRVEHAPVGILVESLLRACEQLHSAAVRNAWDNAYIRSLRDDLVALGRRV